MSRVATLTAVLTMLVVPAASASQAPNINDIGKQAPSVVVDLRSPDAADAAGLPKGHAVQSAGQDLRSPDTRDLFSPSPSNVVAATAEPGSSVGVWGILAIVAAAIAAAVALVAMLRRHRHVGGPLGA